MHLQILVAFIITFNHLLLHSVALCIILQYSVSTRSGSVAILVQDFSLFMEVFFFFHCSFIPWKALSDLAWRQSHLSEKSGERVDETRSSDEIFTTDEVRSSAETLGAVLRRGTGFPLCQSSGAVSLWKLIRGRRLLMQNRLALAEKAQMSFKPHLLPFLSS